MDWTKFNSYGESKNHAFEVMCNMIFNKMVKLEYKEKINHFAYVNGSGGDGGVEAYCELKDGTVIAIQSKWFLNRLESSQFTQLQNSLDTAIKVRPNISKYIICIPRDLTSKKVVKGGNVTENTEDNNWKEFKSKNEGLYPSVELILWDETAIYQRLTDSECTGIFKHFFEDASVSYNEIKLSFDKVKKGWAHTKYIPDLYSQGYIHETVQRFVGSPEINAKRYQSILAVQNSLLKLIDMYNDLLRIPFPEVEASHMDLIKSDLQIIKEWQTSISKILLFVKDGESDNGYFRDNDFELKYLGKTFKDSSMYYHHYFHYSDFERVQKRFYDAVHDCETMFGNYIDNKMIFVGNPGTGKTVGAVSEIQGMFDERTHLPILVRAKDFRYGDSWKKIIIQTLEEKDELIGNYSEHLTASEDTLFRVQCHGFANASISAVEKYSVHIEKAMLTSPEIFRQIFQFIILPVCKNSNHPLGGRLLNHFLRGFGKPAERDVWWSIPAYLCSTYENDWCCYTEINFVEIEVNLEELDQTYTGMPLALAWRLSTVRESEKRKVRVALTQWGIQHEDEFIKLLKVV